MACEICSQAEHVLIDDGAAVAFLAPRPLAKGHVVIAPKSHYPILENVPDEVLGAMMSAANRIGMALFSMGAKGTNLIINNGTDAGQKVPHVHMDLVPRQENDGIVFSWEPMRPRPAQPGGPESVPSVAKQSEERPEPEPDDYSWANLRRIP